MKSIVKAFINILMMKSFLSTVSHVIYAGLRPEIGDGVSRVDILTNLKSRFPDLNLFVFGNYYQMNHQKKCLQEMKRHNSSAKNMPRYGRVSNKGVSV